MSECICLSRCPFFNDKMKNMPHAADVMREHYCLAEWRTCARHRVFDALGVAAVPDDLFPNMNEDADAILTGHRIRL